jgi:hypothetical protein
MENRNTRLRSSTASGQAFQEGLFLILEGRAQAPVWDVLNSGRIQHKIPYSYVNHYSFHILDRDWGHVTSKISGHPPFPAQSS